MPNELVEIYSGIEELSKNWVFGDSGALDRSRVEFYGEGNTLYIEPNAKISDSIITFDGSDSLVYFSRTRHPYVVDIDVKNSSIVYIGDDMYANPIKPLKIDVPSNGSVLLGSRLLLSFGVEMNATHGDITINDYCWLGEQARVVGPVYLDGCSILGSNSVLQDTEISPYSTVVGNGRRLSTKTIHSNDSIKNNGFNYKDRISKSYAETIKRMAREPSVPSINAVADNSLDLAFFITKWKKESSNSIGKRIDLLSALDEGPRSLIRRKLFRRRTNNRIIGNPKQIESQIVFNGSNNCLICSEGVNLKECKITFLGDNGILFLGKAVGCYDIAIDISTDSTVVFMNGCEFRGHTFATASEGRNILVGEDCVFGNGCWIRTSDQHGIYDYQSLSRTNPPKSTVIENGCIVGNGCHLLKGSYLSHGTAIEDDSVVLGHDASMDTGLIDDNSKPRYFSMLNLESEITSTNSVYNRVRLILSLLNKR